MNDYAHDPLADARPGDGLSCNEHARRCREDRLVRARFRTLSTIVTRRVRSRTRIDFLYKEWNDKAVGSIGHAVKRLHGG
jgi:hypothetical protein